MLVYYVRRLCYKINLLWYLLIAQILSTMTPTPKAKAQQTFQFTAPQPLFWPIPCRSLWEDMHGHPRMVLFSRLGGCGSYCSATWDRGIMRPVAHKWGCRGHQDCRIAIGGQCACASDCLLLNGTLLAIWIYAPAKSAQVNHWNAGVFKIWNTATLPWNAATLPWLLR